MMLVLLLRGLTGTITAGGGSSGGSTAAATATTTAQTKTDRLQLAPLAGPDAQEGHERGAGGLQPPPEPVGGYGVRVERGDDEVDEVQRAGEVGDELGAGDEEEEEEDPANHPSPININILISG